MKLKNFWTALFVLACTMCLSAPALAAGKGSPHSDRDRACLAAHGVLVTLYPDRKGKDKQLRGCTDEVLGLALASVQAIRKASNAFSYIPTPTDVFKALRSGSPAGAVKYFLGKYMKKFMSEATGKKKKKVSKVVKKIVKARGLICYKLVKQSGDTTCIKDLMNRANKM